VAQAAPSFAAPPTNFGGATPGLTEPPIAAPADATPLSDYKVVANDNLSKIAAKHHITVKSILSVNPNLDPKKLQVGKTIKIPAIPLPSGEATTATATAPAPSGSTGLSGGVVTGNGTYVVRSGDTLTKIARNHGVTLAQLRAANNLKTTRVLVGQKLKIPARAAAAVPTNSSQH
jgi:peptidoglycan endopeptidase LytE